MNTIDTSFLDKSIGNSVDEMLDFCHKALKLLNEWKKADEQNPMWKVDLFQLTFRKVLL